MDRPSKRKSFNESTPPHVGIVGAGLAGLRCADILLQNGFRVTLIEARDRIGGRIHQEKLPNGRWADMGANWIHGAKGNPFLDLAEKTSTAVVSPNDTSFVVKDSGLPMPQEEAVNDATVMWDIIEDAFKHSNEQSSEIPKEESLWDFFQVKVSEKIPQTSENFQERRKTVLQMSEVWGAYIGNSIQKQSLKFFFLEECIDGENLFCAGSYRDILALIAKPAVKNAEIKLETKADQISYRTRSQEPVKIHVNSGETYQFDEVVVTSPLGWLQKNLHTFDPALPTELAKSIKSVAWGVLEKVYICFPDAFWHSAPDEKDKVRGFIQWLPPNYAIDKNPELWSQTAIELASWTPETSHPTLLFYIHGDQSAFLTTTVAELSSQKEKEDYIFAYFKPYYSRLPFYSESSPNCQPTGFLATDWLHDDLAGNGSYINFHVGLEQGDRDVEIMREGAPDHGLWIAGEHTAPFVALGTATGAYESGEAVGKRITQLYENSSRAKEASNFK